MNKQKHLPMPNQTEANLPLQSGLLGVNTPDSVQRQQHKEHLSRLFRHVDQSPDGLYLQNLIARYRGIGEP